MFALSDILVFGLISAAIVGAIGALVPWSRDRFRFAVIAVADFLGFIAWNLVISHARAHGLDVDAPVLAISWQDVGSGVVSFGAICLALGLLLDREEPARRVVGAATIAGLVTTFFDIFVL